MLYVDRANFMSAHHEECFGTLTTLDVCLYFPDKPAFFLSQLNQNLSHPKCSYVCCCCCGILAIVCCTAVMSCLSLYHPGEKPDVTQTWQANKAWQNQWQNMSCCFSFLTQVRTLQAVSSPGRVVP